MDQTAKITHFYHANADAFGGSLERPFDLTLPVLAPTSLPLVGGYALARHENFEVPGIISIARAYTQVAGSTDPNNGNFVTTVKSVIEGVKIGEIFSADRIAMELRTDHPGEEYFRRESKIGYFPNVSFGDTKFTGLKIGTAELTVGVKTDLFDRDDDSEFPSESALYNSKMMEFARKQSEEMESAGSDPEAQKMTVFQRLFERHRGSRFNSKETIAERGSAILSIVDTITIEGTFDGIRVGNVLSIPDFGRVYLGELVVDHDSFDLNMVRLELGCTNQGKASGPHGGANGTNSGAG